MADEPHSPTEPAGPATPGPARAPQREPLRSRKGARFALIVGSIGVFLGLWLFLDSTGADLPPMSRHWPLFLGVGGLASLVDYLIFSRRASAAGQTLFGLGLAAYCYVFSLGHVDTFGEFLDWLPVLPTLVGVSMLVTWWLSNERRAGLLTVGVVALGLGLSGLAIQFEAFREMLPPAQMVWALLILVAGGMLLWRTFRRP